MAGAPKGNKNAVKGKLWTDAIKRALARKSGTVEQGLNECADEFLKKVCDGDLAAFKELGDRVEGKAPQSLTVGGDEDNPLRTINEVLITPLHEDSNTDTE